MVKLEEIKSYNGNGRMRSTEVSLIFVPGIDVSSELSILKAIRDEVSDLIEEQESQSAKQEAKAEIYRMVNEICDVYDVVLNVTVE